MEPIQCSNRLLSGLLEVLMYATRGGQFDHAQNMLVAMRALRPNFRELDLVEGWLLVGRNQYADAARILRELCNGQRAESVVPFASAMMALCLNALAIRNGTSMPTKCLHAMKIPIPSRWCARSWACRKR